MKPILQAFCTFFLLLPFVVCAQSVTVEMRDDVFDPSSVTIDEGTTVIWENAGSDEHTTTSGSSCNGNGTWDSGLMTPGETFSQTFDNAGQFPYFCVPHCGGGMTGTVIVEDPTSMEERKLDLSGLELYPVPFETDLTLNLSDLGSDVRSIEVMDVEGKRVGSISVQNKDGKGVFHLDASDWDAGVYFVTFYAEDSKGTRRVVKQ